MEYLFESIGDIAQHLLTQAADCRQRSQKDGLTNVQRGSLIGQAFAYEQSAMVVRNSRIVSIT